MYIHDIYIYIYMFTQVCRPAASRAPVALLVRGNLFTARAMSAFAREG